MFLFRQQETLFNVYPTNLIKIYFICLSSTIKEKCLRLNVSWSRLRSPTARLGWLQFSVRLFLWPRQHLSCNTNLMPDVWIWLFFIWLTAFEIVAELAGIKRPVTIQIYPTYYCNTYKGSECILVPPASHRLGFPLPLILWAISKQFSIWSQQGSILIKNGILIKMESHLLRPRALTVRIQNQYWYLAFEKVNSCKKTCLTKGVYLWIKQSKPALY